MKAFNILSPRIFSAGLIIYLLAIYFLLPLSPLIKKVHAASSCTVSVSPSSVPKNDTTTLTFTINNNDATSYDWIKITRPNSLFNINYGNASGWRDDTVSGAITFTLGSISAGGTAIFNVIQTTENTPAAATNWTVQVSDNGGTSTATCAGNTSVSISGEWGFPVEQSEITVTSITATSATISWTTTRPATTDLQYGTTTSYGSSSSDSSLETTHSFTLTGLSPETTYYYFASNTDDSGNTAEAGDQFTTAVAEVVETGTDPVITSLLVSSITTTSLVISWTTDIAANSLVRYGTSTSYGTTETEAPLVTSHSVALSGLTSATTYHYRVESTSALSNTGLTSDNTFTTSTATSTTTPTPTPTTTPTPTPSSTSTSATATPTPTSTTSTTSTNTPTPNPQGSPTPTPTITYIKTPDGKLVPVIPQDTTPPQIKLIANVTKPFTTAPQMSVSAADEKGIRSVEFSIDGGLNWLPIDNNSFTPPVKEDGNYPIKARAIDTSGNIGLSDEKTLVIDRLPPRVGGNVLSLGSQVIVPTSDGSIVMLSGFNQKITMSAIGGATNVDLISNTSDAKQMFSLVKTPQNGLWSGAMSFVTPGNYKVNVRAIDGAGHKVERNLNDVIVLPSGKILDEDEKPIEGATITLFYQNPSTKLWTKWDASAFKQSNPQISLKDGSYHYYVPAGRYYMRIQAKGSKPIVTDIFVTDKATPLNTKFTLKPSAKIKIIFFEIVLPDFFNESAKVDTNFDEKIKTVKASSLVGRKMTKFELPYSTGTNFKSTSLLGRKSLISFISSWSPASLEQVGIIDKLIESGEVLGVIVSVGESKTKISLFQKRGKYRSRIVTDSEISLANSYRINTLPTHFFLDEGGVIKKVLFGVLSEKEFLDAWKSY